MKHATNPLTVGSRVLFENETDADPVKNFPTFEGNRSLNRWGSLLIAFGGISS
jgi:hypothetical protein